jgi:serine/threonine protein kinase
MGEVYRARDTKLGREVAIKTLPAGLSGGEHLARFKREARAASALNHPHICTIYDLCEHGDTPFIVMELLKGDVLSDLLVRGPLGLDQALGLGVQLAEALEAAHARGHHPPRYQAGQHLRDPSRRCEDSRLRRGPESSTRRSKTSRPKRQISSRTPVV